MSRKLLPIGDTEAGELLVNAISARIAALVGKQAEAGIWICPAAIDIVAAIERYKDGEISAGEAAQLITAGRDMENVRNGN